MQLYLIRHAESENNARPAYQRSEDPPLTAVGRLQAQHLSDWMVTIRIDKLLSSPVRRALQTTQLVASATGLHVHVWSDLYEEGGIYRGHGPEAIEGGPGLSRADVVSHFAGPAACTLDHTITESGWWNRPRETADQAVQRAALVARRLVDTFAAQPIAVAAVIHADFKRKLLAQLLGSTIDVEQLGALRNTGVSKVDFDGRRWQLDWFNSVTHLPAKLITGNES